jgi:hypothetical protein
VARGEGFEPSMSWLRTRCLKPAWRTPTDWRKRRESNPCDPSRVHQLSRLRRLASPARFHHFWAGATMSSMPAFLPIILALLVLACVGTWIGLEQLANRLHKSLSSDSKARRYLRLLFFLFLTKDKQPSAPTASVVPRAGIEPALSKEPAPEAGATPNSAIGG